MQNVEPERRWRSLQMIACLLLLYTMASGRCLSAERPNIVLIMCDDMGYSDIGCMGSEIETPHIDSLARDGMLFTQFYNNAKCTTTRASIITGLYPRPKGGLLKPNMVTIPEVLRTAGYHTALTGKWHLGAKAPRRPSDRGFHEYYGLLDGCCNFFNPIQPDPKFKGGRIRKFFDNDKPVTKFPDDYYTTDAFTDYAIDVIEKSANAGAGGQKPFFLHVCYTAPHYPLHAKPADIKKYKGRYKIGWDALRKQRYKKQLELGLVEASWKHPEPNREVKPWTEETDHDWQDLRMSVYAAMVDNMDQNIGRLLKSLEDTGQADNTIVMFLSDNGGCAEEPGGADRKQIPGPKEYYAHVGPGWAWAQNSPFRRYKQWVHEGGISTPLLVRWPGIVKAGSRTNQVSHIIDIMATCCELSETSYPAKYNDKPILPLEGRSLVPILKGEQREPHETLCWEWSNSRAIRQGDMKLCWDRGVQKWELYNVVSDRTETQDLSEQHPERVESMSKAWFEWAKKTTVRTTPKKKSPPKTKQKQAAGSK